MNWIYILTFVTAALAQWSQGQPMKAQFHMNGVTGQADLTESGGTLTIRLNIDNNLGMTTVEIHPIWVNYDGMDKCSPKMLGNAMSGLSKDATIQAGVPVDVTFSNMPPADFADGYSLVLRDPQSQSEICCATIQQSVDYVTAMVRFRGTVLGDVYLRQANVAGSSTRIVYDLATQTDAQAANWRITDSYTTCEEFMKNIFHAIYDIRTSESDGCSSVDARQKECAIGDLTGKLDLIGFAPNVGSSMRKAVTDYNLPLFGDNNVDNLLMLILPIGKEIMPACGKINVYAERSAKAVFSNDGVTGTIKFSQKSPLDPTVTSVNLQGLQSFAGGYHVHMWPVPERQASSQTSMCSPGHVSGHFNPFIDQVGTPGSDSYPDAGTSTYDMFEVGDLSGKYGLLNGEMSKSGTYTDYNLQLFGTNSIVGRSLVIHRNDATSSRWVCVNIEPQYPVITAEALFLHPVIGRVLFMQERDRPELDTSVFARLDYIDETPDTRNHKWMVGKMGPGSLVLDEPPSCESTVYNPESLWQNKDDSQYSMLCMGNSATCITGDLSGKLGLLDIGYQSTTEDEAKKWFATDTYLPLSSPHSIIRQPIVIRNVENSQILACATIQPVHPVALVAQLTSGTVTGTVRFSQEPGFGSKQTTVKRSLKGFTDGQRLQIRELPPLSEGQSPCSDLGMVFDPLKVGDSLRSSNTDDKYKIGDLSRFSSDEGAGYNLPLSGVNSIRGRSLVVVDDQSNVVSCTTIDWDMAGWTELAAKATFTGQVTGTITLHQRTHLDGTMSDTSIVTDLKYSNASEYSQNHNWHTHVKLVSGDSQADSGKCMSTGPHYNPFKADVGGTAYASKCSQLNHLRCELGDQSKKTMTIDVGRGRKLHTDTFLPLFGRNSVQCRSIVVHVENKGAARFACTDIVPQTESPVPVTFSTPTTFSSLSETDKMEQIRKTYSDLVRSYPGELNVVIQSSNTQETTVLVHFLGTRSSIIRTRFLEYINDENKVGNLGSFRPVVPVPGLNFAVSTSTNIFVILVALIPSIISSTAIVSW